MGNEMTESTGALDPMTYVVPRLEGLIDVLEPLGIKTSLRLSEGEVPFLEGEREDGAIIFFSYIPVDVNGEFILQLSRSLDAKVFDMDTVLLDIASFNMGSEFGFAVMDPTGVEVVLRAQVPETGGVSLEWSSFILDLFDGAYDELLKALLTEDSKEA